MNEIINYEKNYKAVENALKNCAMGENIKTISRNKTLDFEISAITQAINKNITEAELSEFISKFINQSFDSKFKPINFSDAAKEIIKNTTIK